MSDTLRLDELIDRYLAGELTGAELAEFQAMLVADPSAANHFAARARLDAEIAACLRTSRAAGQMHRTLEQLPHPTARRRWIFAASVAALICICAIAGRFMRGEPAKDHGGGVASIASGRFITRGETASQFGYGDELTSTEDVSVLALKDGSRVALVRNACVVLRAPQPGERPAIELRSGSAYFTVARSNDVFRVRTAVGSVRVVGTEFSVELRPAGDADETNTAHGEPIKGGDAMQIQKLLVVAVVTGLVEVSVGGSSYSLGMGERRVFGEEAKEGTHAQTKVGVVRRVDVADRQIIVMVTRELTFTATTSTRIAQHDEARKLEDIHVGDRVSVEYIRESDALRRALRIVILGKEEPKAGEEHGNEIKPEGGKAAEPQNKTGTVVRVNAGEREIVVMVSREMTFKVPDGIRIAQHDVVKKLSDIPVGAKVRVDYTREGDTRTATRILILE